MGFTTGNLPPVDPETFADRPLFERIRILSTHWVEYGFGTPKMVHAIYVVKLVVLYICGGLFVATATSGLGPFWHVSSYWTEPIVYEKLILWTVLLETLGIAGSWGPLAGHFKPMTGGVLYWARPDTIRLPPWPERVPFTRGDRRTVADVVLYLAIVATSVVALVAPSVSRDGTPLVNPTILFVLVGLLVVMGLRDKVVFLAARSEQYIPAIVFFATLGYVDLIVALKLLIVAVWVGAGVSKIGRHFTRVVVPMVSNTPWVPRSLKRRNVRSFPDDLRPSHAATLLAHVGGSTVEIVLPLVLLFSTNPTVTLLAVVGMVIFHLFILSTFPIAVPLEWNALFAFATVFLFWGHPAWEGFAVADFSSPVVLVAIVAGLLFFPVLGNLRPDLVSFLPSMRQYAGNWASAMWAFAPGAESKLDRITRAAGNTVDQLAATYPRPVAELLAHHAGGMALDAQPRAGAAVDVHQAPRRRHRPLRPPRGRVRLQHRRRVQLRRRPLPRRAAHRSDPAAMRLRTGRVPGGVGRVPADPQGPSGVQGHRRRTRHHRARDLPGRRHRRTAPVAARRAHPAAGDLEPALAPGRSTPVREPELAEAV